MTYPKIALTAIGDKNYSKFVKHVYTELHRKQRRNKMITNDIETNIKGINKKKKILKGVRQEYIDDPIAENCMAMDEVFNSTI